MSDPVALLATLIGFRTDNPPAAPDNELKLATFLARELERRGAAEVGVAHTDGKHATVWARFGTPRLLVNAHLDTVPANAGWTTDPWTAVRKGDRLYGLGSADTKGAIAAVLCALDEATPRDTLVVFSGDEELGGACMRDFLLSPAARGLERAIVCEPTSCRAGTRHRGIMTIEAAVAGEGGHSSMADRMPAPIPALAALAVRFHEWGRSHVDQGPPGFLGMCLNVAKLDGGVAFNVVPATGMLTTSLRPPPGADAAALRAELIALAARTVPGCTTNVPLDNPPFATRDLESFRPFLGAVIDAPLDLGYWTEAALLSAAGIDAVVYGPGDIAKAHAADEFVPVADLETARAQFVAAFTVTATR